MNKTLGKTIDATASCGPAAKKAWAVFKEEWSKEYEGRQLARETRELVEKAARKAAEEALAKTEAEAVNRPHPKVGDVIDVTPA